LDPASDLSFVGVRVHAGPSGEFGNGDPLPARYAACVEELLSRVQRGCAVAVTGEEKIPLGVAALLESLSSQPRLATTVLIDAPSVDEVASARADAHRRFAELVIGLSDGPSAPRGTVEAGIRTIENVLAANLIGGGPSCLPGLAPVVGRVVLSLLAGGTPRRRPGLA
jgi:hypothetical protein